MQYWGVGHISIRTSSLRVVTHCKQLCQHYTLYNTQLKIVRQRTSCFASSPDEGYNATRKHIRIADGCAARRLKVNSLHCHRRFDSTLQRYGGKWAISKESCLFFVRFFSHFFHCKDTARENGTFSFL